MYQKYLKYKNIYKNSNIADQHLINDLAQKQIGYLPVRFGLFSPFRNDNDSDNHKYPVEKIQFFGYKSICPSVIIRRSNNSLKNIQCSIN